MRYFMVSVYGADYVDGYGCGLAGDDYGAGSGGFCGSSAFDRWAHGLDGSGRGHGNKTGGGRCCAAHDSGLTNVATRPLTTTF